MGIRWNGRLCLATCETGDAFCETRDARWEMRHGRRETGDATWETRDAFARRDTGQAKLAGFLFSNKSLLQ